MQVVGRFVLRSRGPLPTARCSLLLLPLLLLWPSPSSPLLAATINVPGDQPTLQTAVAAASDDDVILLAPGVHTGGVFVDGKSLTVASRFYTTGDTAYIGQTIISGVVSNVCGGRPGCVGHSVLEFGKSAGGSAVVGLTLTDGDDGVYSSSRVDIVHCRIFGVGDGMDYQSGSGGTISNNLFGYNRDDGIDLNGTVDVRILDNIIRNNKDDGIEFRLYPYRGAVLTTEILRNQFVGNGEDGIQFIDSPDSSNRVLRVERNVFAGNRMAAVGCMGNQQTTEDFSGSPIAEPVRLIHNTFSGENYGFVGGAHVVALNNVFVGTTHSALRRVGGGSIASFCLFWSNGLDYEASNVDSSHTLRANPLLDADHTLMAGSPAINAGTAFFQWLGQVILNVPPTSYSGSAPDMGAFESSSGGPPPANTPPTVDAGPSQAIGLPADAMLDGTVGDDGFPDPPGVLAVDWSVGSGPGPVTFLDVGAVDTHASFTAAGTYVLRLTANDGALSAMDSVQITVLPSNEAPVASLRVLPATGVEPLAVTADASGSLDPDGTIATYRFDFGDGVVVGPQPSPTATHSYAAGNWTAVVTVTDDLGGTDSKSVLVVVTGASGEPNLAGNPSFEVNTSGWSSYAGAALQRVAGGIDGAWALQMTGPSSVASFGCNDSPNWVASTAAVGTRYRFTAWVRSTAAAGSARLQVREYVGSTGVGSVYSSLVPLSSTWQMATVDYVNVRSGSTLDFHITDVPLVAGEVVVADNISIRRAGQAPVVTAPAAALVDENQPLTVTVTATDPDGDSIASLTAGGLPSGASFNADAGNLVGTLSWTPSYAQAGSYDVTFMASNTLAGSASTLITVSNVDRAPIVTAPATVSVHENEPLTVNVSAVDPDGDEILSLLAGDLPLGSEFSFGAANSIGTLSWAPSYTQAGSYTVTFTASNALSGSASTVITVLPSNEAPVASLSVLPATGVEPLAVTADASGSLDPDGTIATYRFDFGDGVVVGPQTSPTATHSYAAGNWTAVVTVTDDLGGTDSKSVLVVVTGASGEPNLAGNPSFEVNTSGWNSYGGAALLRVAGGIDGGWALQMTGPSSVASFGCNDSPNWVASTAAVGTRYRFTAWVRSPGGTGSARLQVREYVGATRFGSVYSSLVPLSPSWQKVTVDYVNVRSGSTLDYHIDDVPRVAGEVFVIDNISILIIPATIASLSARGPTLDFSASLSLGAPVSPHPLRSKSILAFMTSQTGRLQITVFDVAGRQVRSLLDEPNASAGLHRVWLDGADDRGEKLPSGMYFYSIRSQDAVSRGRFIVLR